MNETTAAADKNGKVLVIDDNALTLNAMGMALCDDFTVAEARSGEEGLELLAGFEPDIVLLDIEMDGIDGYETCRRLRERHDMPVIFVSSHDTLEERLHAFDSGGDDFIVKPFDAEVLHRKVCRMFELLARHERLAEEKKTSDQIAMGFLQSIGETGVLLNFIRSNLGCIDYAELAERLLAAVREYGVNCHVQVRHADGAVSMTPHGPATPLEASILDQSAGLGRMFQFKRRFVVNYPLVSILILQLPEDNEIAGRMRDNIAILAENAEAIAETIGVRKESAIRAEALQAAALNSYQAIDDVRSLYRQQQVDTRILLDQLIKEVEDTYLFLGLTENQEHTVSATMRRGAEQILQLFALSEELDRRFAGVLESLAPTKQPAETW